MNPYLRFAVRYVAPVAVLGIAVGVVIALFSASSDAPKADEGGVEPAPLPRVEVVEVRSVSETGDIRAHGTVVPARRAGLRPVVEGVVEEVGSDFEAGEFVDEGELLVRFDREPFEFAVERREAAVDRAEAEVDLAEGRKTVAEKEWKSFRKQYDPKVPSDSKLAQGEPQWDRARARLDGAKAQLKRAKWRLEHTEIRAPFDAYVARETVEEGEFLRAGVEIGRLVGTDRVWVDAKVPVEQLGFLRIPGMNADAGEGAEAEIRVDTGSRTAQYDGRIVRLLRDANKRKSGMAEVRIRVADPFGRGDRDAGAGAAGRSPLLLGSYVGVSLATARAQRLVRVPRRAVRGNDGVFVFEPSGEEGKGTVRAEQLEIVRSSPDAVYVQGGVASGDRVVVSALSRDRLGREVRRVEAASSARAERSKTAPDAGSSPSARPERPETMRDAGTRD